MEAVCVFELETEPEVVRVLNTVVVILVVRLVVGDPVDVFELRGEPEILLDPVLLFDFSPVALPVGEFLLVLDCATEYEYVGEEDSEGVFELVFVLIEDLDKMAEILNFAVADAEIVA